MEEFMMCLGKLFKWILSIFYSTFHIRNFFSLHTILSDDIFNSFSFADKMFLAT